MSSVTAGGEAQAAGYVEEFFDATDWHPDRIGLFGGALRFSEFGFLKRFKVKQVANRTIPDLDTSRDAEFTDWDGVADFANDVAAFVERRLDITAPDTRYKRCSGVIFGKLLLILQESADDYDCRQLGSSADPTKPTPINWWSE